MKLSLIAAIFAVIGTSAALADDQQLQNRLALDRAQNASRAQETTVAVYANRRDMSRPEISSNDRQSETRFELRSNAHGQTFGLWVEVK